ncbi:forkhead box protein O isoform X1 [Plodia interpunctella]|uniref:forkhead box protein O isoform X1 n=1 Tax=Plodia interpunctella TaxID=58824 RepID=UPI0023687589|nr:forkhead box protein O isoform X1 [Plodia interpunctella]XP_053603613.1 forkhead box protein O isoform X1 [Plodia interpunctella]
MSLQGGGNYQSPWSSQTGLAELEGQMGELEPLGELVEAGFEPQTRARSNTWPLPRPDNYVDPADDTGSKKNSTQNLAGAPPLPSSAVTAKKNSSRRNAWGNLSYADLITQAITSAQDNRLTLSQIYEWMVQNVPYFKDKGDSNSSAGWKNSIRHNLSLHNRFMRVQNEGTGKSSWWMINPDAKPGKSVRRRAASMETSKFEKRRGRVKKKAEALRNGVTADATPSPSSSISESLDMFPDSPLHSNSYQLSPDFRQRASSNASSVGRMSPIPSMLAQETDWGEAYTPAGDFTSNSDFSQIDYAQDEQLAGTLADSMKLQGATDPFLNTFVPTTSSSTSGNNYRYPTYGTCPRHLHVGCACASIYSSPAHPAHPTHPHQHALDHFVRPPAPADPADIMQIENNQTQMVTTSDAALMNGGMMVQTGAMGPTTVMGQIMGALNTGLVEDLNIESLEPGFDCNVDEVIKHELSMDGTLDFNFTQQHMAAEAESQFVAPAPPVPTTLSGGGAPRTPYSVAPSWVH